MSFTQGMEGNMSQYRRFAVLALIAVCAIAIAGCRSKKTGGVLGPDGKIIDEPVMFEDERLAPRPMGAFDILADVQFAASLFDYDSAHVIESERAKVDAAVEYLRQNPALNVIIEGHCDERGSADYNLALGERRALAVRAYMIGLGVDPSRIQTKSYGKEKPVALGHDESAWRFNRRAEFVFYRE
jgi:peptidoglycan-associated lipoprotein